MKEKKFWGREGMQLWKKIYIGGTLYLILCCWSIKGDGELRQKNKQEQKQVQAFVMINLDTNTLSVRMSSKSYEYFSDICKRAFYVDSGHQEEHGLEMGKDLGQQTNESFCHMIKAQNLAVVSGMN